MALFAVVREETGRERRGEDMQQKFQSWGSNLWMNVWRTNSLEYEVAALPLNHALPLKFMVLIVELYIIKK